MKAFFNFKIVVLVLTLNFCKSLFSQVSGDTLKRKPNHKTLVFSERFLKVDSRINGYYKYLKENSDKVRLIKDNRYYIRLLDNKNFEKSLKEKFNSMGYLDKKIISGEKSSSLKLGFEITLIDIIEKPLSDQQNSIKCRYQVLVTFQNIDNNGLKEIRLVYESFPIKYQSNPKVDHFSVVFPYIDSLYSSTVNDLVNTLMKNPDFEKTLQWQEDSSNTLIGIPISQKRVLNAPFEELDSSIVTIVFDDKHTQTGFFVNAQGDILTNYPKANNINNNVSVILSNGKSFKVPLRRWSSTQNLAWIHIEGLKSKPLELSSEDRPLQLIEEIYSTYIDLGNKAILTDGIVSGKRDDNGRTRYQTDLRLSNSYIGAPVLNAKGIVVGIVDSKIVAPGVEGLTFFTPIHEAAKALNLYFQAK